MNHGRISLFRSIAASLVAASFGCSSSNEPGNGSGSGAGNAGQFVELRAVFLDETQVVSHQFRIVNDGAKKLKIVGVHPSCTCTDAQVDRRELAPGESTELSMRSNVAGRSGDFVATCRVATDSGEEAREYGFRCTVVEPLAFVPSDLHLGLVTSAAHVERTLYADVCSRTSPPETPTLTLGDTDKTVGFKVLASEVSEIASGVFRRRLTVQLTYQAPSPLSPGPGKATLRATIVRTGKELAATLPVQWMGKSLYRIDPATAADPARWTVLGRS